MDLILDTFCSIWNIV